MKRLFVSVLILLLLPTLLAQEEIAPAKRAVFPVGLKLVGKGIAIKRENPEEFIPVKIGVGRVAVWLPQLEDIVEVDVGVLFIGPKRFSLKNMQMEPNYFFAEIYRRRIKVGEITLNLERKYWQLVWKGNLFINVTLEEFNKTVQGDFIVYILEPKKVFVPRPIPTLPRVRARIARKITKIRHHLGVLRKIAECIKEPTGRGCRALFEKCLRNETTWCRKLINAYCEKIGDPRCKILIRPPVKPPIPVNVTPVNVTTGKPSIKINITPGAVRIEIEKTVPFSSWSMTIIGGNQSKEVDVLDLLRKGICTSPLMYYGKELICNKTLLEEEIGIPVENVVVEIE